MAWLTSPEQSLVPTLTAQHGRFVDYCSRSVTLRAKILVAAGLHWKVARFVGWSVAGMTRIVHRDAPSACGCDFADVLTERQPGSVGAAG